MSPLAISPNASNLLLGRGTLFVDRLDANGNRTGEFALGNCTAFGLSTTDSVKEKYNSQVSVSSVYGQALSQRVVELDITGDEFSDQNLQLLFAGTSLNITQSSATLTASALTTSAKQGRWYEVGARNISAVVVKVATVAKTLGTDYTVDATRGRIYIVPGGGIADSASVTVDATVPTITTLPAIAGGNVSQINAFVRFIGDPAAGPVFEVEAWRVNLTPAGQVGFIADDYGNWQLKGKVLDDRNNHPTCPYFRVIEPA